LSDSYVVFCAMKTDEPTVALWTVVIRVIRYLIFETVGLGWAVLIREVGLSMDEVLYIHKVPTALSQRVFFGICHRDDCIAGSTFENFC
jgi:hypothetical protein